MQNVSDNKDMLQRLEARFKINVHLESSEVGTVIEDRVLRKKPTARPSLEQLWSDNRAQIQEIAEPPGLELGGSYPAAERERFVKDYPFLPYQIPAAADIFGGMRGVKISAGARSMIKVVFDATRELADRPLGAVVSWDQIFDSANSDNEFADEQYLGSQGLTYIGTADRDVKAPVGPSRVLKTLWLVQRSARIPRTPRNLARLLVDRLDLDVLKLEQEVLTTLQALADQSFVRQEVTTDQWRFLGQDEVTVEKIVARISAEDVKQKDVREELRKLYEQQLRGAFNGRLTAGKNNTAFEYGLFFNDAVIRNEAASVSLRVAVAGSSVAESAAARNQTHLDDPVVSWEVAPPAKLEERLRRVLAVRRLPDDDEYRRVATEKTRYEAEKLEREADQLLNDAGGDVERTLQSGVIRWAGNAVTVEAVNGAKGGHGAQTAAARGKVEEALRDRVVAKYTGFGDGDRVFQPANIEKLLNVAAADRPKLDPGLGLFSVDGHINGNNPLVEALAGYLKFSTKTAGQDVTDHFGGVPYGWQPDLLRYVAAAMFVDAKLTAIDKAGKRYDDPKQPMARTLFGTAAFRSTRFEVEEDALTPDEASAARTFLAEQSRPATDSGEIAL